MNFWNTLPHPFTILAPMEEVTDTVFRKLVHDCGGADVYFTEFIHATDYLNPKIRLDRKYSYIDPSETYRPLVAQIWGNNPEHYRLAIPRLLQAGFSGIDINMGCPAHKKVRRGCCAGLIGNYSLAGELIQAAQEAASPYPVSVKTRLGIKKRITEDWAGFLLTKNLPVLTIHARIAEQMSEGEADWSEIAKVVRLRDQLGSATRVVGNGDLFSAELMDARLAESGVDGLMVGRGIFRDPYILRKDRPHRHFYDYPEAEKIALCLHHVREHQRVWGKTKRYDVIKGSMKHYTEAFDGCLDLRQSLMEAQTHDQALALLTAWQQQRGLT